MRTYKSKRRLQQKKKKWRQERGEETGHQGRKIVVGAALPCWPPTRGSSKGRWRQNSALSWSTNQLRRVVTRRPLFFFFLTAYARVDRSQRKKKSVIRNRESNRIFKNFKSNMFITNL